ncbi:MAG: hypothetical protein ACRDSK_23675 [Actinophytocola sp.]|uniref:hypothetical protein n=1 Tax=Actinophytocola sp. TaxID=1872138 RepID=UPI003D6AC5F7
MTRHAAVLLLAGVLLVPACTARTGAASAPTTPPTTTTTSSAPSSSAPPAPTAAADGGNVAACRDAVCEVRLTGRTVIPVGPATGIAEVAVESIVDDAVTAAITLSGNEFSLDCQGDSRCETSIVGTTPPVAFITAHPGARVAVNRVVVAVTAAADGVAVLRLSRS